MAATIDEALEILHRTGPDWGNSNHGPMVAEALCALGRPDVVIPWIDGYKSRFQDRPQTRTSIARQAARHAWQACTAIYAWYSTTPPASPAGFMPPTEDREALIDRAVAAVVAHTIKFTAACLREYALNPQSLYLVAARDAAERVGPSFQRLWAEAGSLLSYGVDLDEMCRRSATYLDRILKGAKPADLPVEGPTKFELIINLKTAKSLGLTLPPTLLFQADEIIR